MAGTRRRLGRLSSLTNTGLVVRQPIGTQLLKAIDEAVESRWSAAQTRARTIGDGDRDERVAALTTALQRELGVAGAAAGGTASIPGIGLATTSAAFVVELGWTTIRLADLILTIAAIHGHDRATFDERRLWVLSILTYRGGAVSAVGRLADDLAGPKSTTRTVSRRSLQRMNSIIGSTIVARYGARRGVAAVGRAIPFGIGAVLGYGINVRTVALTAQHAHDFFTDFPITLDAIDVQGTKVAGMLPRASRR